MRLLPEAAGTLAKARGQDQGIAEVNDSIAAAILAHAEAIRELAQAIREHTQSMFISEDEQEEDAPPQFYMDGTPVQ